MNWKSGCGWFFAVYLFVAVILTAFGVQPAVAVWACLAITVLLTGLYHWLRKAVRPSLREEPPSAHLRSSRRRTSAKRQGPRPHRRRGHPHSYWIGPRDDPARRKKVKRWVDTIHVGGSHELDYANRTPSLILAGLSKLEWLGTGSRHIYRWLRCKIRDKHYWQQVGTSGGMDYETGRRLGTFVCRICGKWEFRR